MCRKRSWFISHDSAIVCDFNQSFNTSVLWVHTKFYRDSCDLFGVNGWICCGWCPQELYRLAGSVPTNMTRIAPATSSGLENIHVINLWCLPQWWVASQCADWAQSRPCCILCVWPKWQVITRILSWSLLWNQKHEFQRKGILVDALGKRGLTFVVTLQIELERILESHKRQQKQQYSPILTEQEVRMQDDLQYKNLAQRREAEKRCWESPIYVRSVSTVIRTPI